jgi:hypothetical protein
VPRQSRRDTADHQTVDTPLTPGPSPSGAFDLHCRAGLNGRIRPVDPVTPLTGLIADVFATPVRRLPLTIEPPRRFVMAVRYSRDFDNALAEFTDNSGPRGPLATHVVKPRRSKEAGRWVALNAADRAAVENTGPIVAVPVDDQLLMSPRTR